MTDGSGKLDPTKDREGYDQVQTVVEAVTEAIDGSRDRRAAFELLGDAAHHVSISGTFAELRVASLRKLLTDWDDFQRELIAAGLLADRGTGADFIRVAALNVKIYNDIRATVLERLDSEANVPEVPQPTEQGVADKRPPTQPSGNKWPVGEESLRRMQRIYCDHKLTPFTIEHLNHRQYGFPTNGAMGQIFFCGFRVGFVLHHLNEDDSSAWAKKRGYSRGWMRFNPDSPIVQGWEKTLQSASESTRPPGQNPSRSLVEVKDRLDRVKEELKRHRDEQAQLVKEDGKLRTRLTEISSLLKRHAGSIADLSSESDELRKEIMQAEARVRAVLEEAAQRTGLSVEDLKAFITNEGGGA